MVKLMMIKRVFCYSREIAKKNGNKLPIIQLVVGTLIYIFIMVLTASLLQNIVIFILLFIIFFIFLIYYSVLFGLRLKSRLIGYALDSNGRIFEALIINNGQGLYFGGIAAGSLIDQLIGTDSNIGSDFGGIIGASAQIYSTKRSIAYMSHPEIIAKMVEEAPNITGAEVHEILKVYSIVNKKRFVEVKCDYKNIRMNKITFQKKITIEKSYNMYEDLIEELNRHS